MVLQTGVPKTMPRAGGRMALARNYGSLLDCSFPEDGGDPSELARHGLGHAEGLEEVGVLPPCVSSGGEAMIVCAMG